MSEDYQVAKDRTQEPDYEDRVKEIREQIEAVREDPQCRPYFGPHIDLDWVARQVANAPPFTEEQIAALIPLMRTGLPPRK